MKRNVLITAILFSVLIVGCHKKSSNDDNNLSFDEIKNKIESAQDGDTIELPVGTCDITAGISVNKNITLTGAGIDKTILVSYLTEENKVGLTVTGNNNQPNDKLRITGITFKQSDQTSGNWSTVLKITGTCRKFRIDHCRFDDGGYAYGISISGYTYGVIDHCEFVDATRENILIADVVPGDASWTRGLSLGTENAVYVEDCNFTYNTQGQQVMSANYGARYVFRHNTFWSAAALNAQPLDAHGNSDYGRGTVSIEVYDNTFHSEQSWLAIMPRGGAGVIFNNTFTGAFTMLIDLRDYRSFNYTVTGWITAHPENYPQPDQINNFYIWNNTYNGKPLTDGVPANYVEDLGYQTSNIKNGRDYFEYAMPGYTPYTYPHPLTKE